MAEEPFSSNNPRTNCGGHFCSSFPLEGGFELFIFQFFFSLSSSHRESFLDARYVNIRTARQNVPKFRNQVHGLFSILLLSLPSSSWRRARRGSKSLASVCLPRLFLFCAAWRSYNNISHKRTCTANNNKCLMFIYFLFRLLL